LDKSLGLLEHFTDEQHIRGGTITDNIVLGSRSTSNHGGCGVLDLHLVEQNVAVLG